MRRFSSQTLTAVLAQSVAASAAATAAASGLPTVYSSLTAGEAIQTGDLLVQGGDGLAYWATDPNLPGSTNRPPFLANDNVQTNTAPPIAGMMGLTTAYSGTPAVLANGNIVVATYTGSGTAVFSIYTPAGALVAGPIQSAYSMGTTTGNCLLSIAALSAGGFVIGYAGGNQNYPALERYDDSGRLVGSTIQLETVTFRAYQVWLTPLQNGGIAAAWFTTSGNQVKIAFFDASLTQQGSTLLVLTAGGMYNSAQYQQSECVRVVAAPNGNVIVAFVTGTGVVYTAIYSQAGAVVSAAASTGLTVSSGTTTSLVSFSLVPTSDNGAAASWSVGTAGRLVKINAAGAVVGAVQTLTTAIAPVGGICLRLAPVAGGGVLWAWSCISGSGPNGQTVWGVFDANMAVVNAPALLNVNGSTAYGYTYIYPMLLPNGDVAILSDMGGTAMYGTRVGLSSGAWVQRDTGAALTLGVTYTPANYGIGLGNAIPVIVTVVLNDALSISGNAFALCPQKGTAGIALNIVNAFLVRRSVIGVATAGAAKGSQVTVQSLGVIQTRLTFTKPFAVDQTALTPAGQKMSIVGNKAVVRGLQP